MADFKPHVCGDNNLYIPSVCDEEGAYFDGLTDRTITQGTDFDLSSGVTAYDSEGNITTYSVSPTEVDCCEVGTQTFTYSSAEVTETREITVIQASNPTFSGLSSLSIGIGDTVSTLDGVTATDALGRSVTVTCTQGGSVTYGIAGDYTLTYTAEDECGNIGTATRSVHVGLGHFVGVVDASVNQGVGFDLENGVTAYDENGNVVPFSYTPTEIDECAVGNQTVTYTATGVETATRVITVNEIDYPTISGASESLSVGIGAEFDPLTGVTGTDGNGNSCTVTATLKPVTYRTVLYNDGTFIINEPSNKSSDNVAEHGIATNVYDPLNEDNDYVFSASTNVPWKSVEGSILDVEVGTPIAPTDMSYWFVGTGITSFDFTDIDTSSVVGMNYTFADSSLTSVDFALDVPSLTSVSGMFSSCYDLQSVALQLNGATPTDMSSMFSSDSSLASVDVSDIGTSAVTNMSRMFNGCTPLTNLSLCNFDTSSVDDMSYMFAGCTSLTKINASELFDTSNVSISTYMFKGDTNLVGGNGTAYNTSYVDKTYAVIDSATEAGYFTSCGDAIQDENEVDISTEDDDVLIYVENTIQDENGVDLSTEDGDVLLYN